MQIREKVEGLRTCGFICDVCKKSCNKSDNQQFESHEHATLFGDWGFFSNNRDTTATECHLCENCYDRVVEFIETLGGQVRRNDGKEGIDWVQHSKKMELQAIEEAKAVSQEGHDIMSFLEYVTLMNVLAIPCSWIGIWGSLRISGRFGLLMLGVNVFMLAYNFFWALYNSFELLGAWT